MLLFADPVGVIRLPRVLAVGTLLVQTLRESSVPSFCQSKRPRRDLWAECQSGAGPLCSPLWARGWSRGLGGIGASFQRKGWRPSDTRPGVHCRRRTVRCGSAACPATVPNLVFAMALPGRTIGHPLQVRKPRHGEGRRLPLSHTARGAVTWPRACF